MNKVLTILLFPAALALGQWVAARAPQRSAAEGTDVLAVLFGGARQGISLSLFDKADVYYHGGVESVDCDHGLSDVAGRKPAVTQAGGAGTTAAGTPETAGEPAEAGEDHDEHDEHGQQAGPATLAAYRGDLWSYLNAQIHPTSHRHMAGERSERELLPWLWASARLDPHNVLAYEVGAYWLARRLHMVDEGLRFVAEGIRNNPDSADLEFCRGELLLSARKDYDGASQAFEQVRRKWQPGTTDEEKDDNRFLLARAFFCLGDIHLRRDELAMARDCYLEVLKITPNHRSALAKLNALNAGTP